MSCYKDELYKIADIHQKRINDALNYVNHIYPLTADKIKSLHEQEILWIDMLIFRFGKLQDLIGNKLIDFYLNYYQENTDSFTMFDKIHKLEKLKVIPNVEIWKNMRQIRNHISHEYPDHPELTAKYLNQLIDSVSSLIMIYNKLKVD